MYTNFDARVAVPGFLTRYSCIRGSLSPLRLGVLQILTSMHVNLELPLSRLIPPHGYLGCIELRHCMITGRFCQKVPRCGNRSWVYAGFSSNISWIHNTSRFLSGLNGGHYLTGQRGSLPINHESAELTPVLDLTTVENLEHQAQNRQGNGGSTPLRLREGTSLRDNQRR